MNIINSDNLIDFLNKIIKLNITDDAFEKSEGNLINYVDRNVNEYNRLISWLDENKGLNESVCTYIKENVETYKRVDIPESFNLDGFDIRSFRVIEDESPEIEKDNKDIYTKFMTDIFGFDFSSMSVELYFLNDYNEYNVPEKLLLHSFNEHSLWKESNDEWKDRYDILIIGMYEYGSLIIVRDGKVYEADEYELVNADEWAYVCDVVDIKKEIEKIKQISIKSN